MAPQMVGFVEQLRAERAVLVKAEADIIEGTSRLQKQRALLKEMELAGYDTMQAERLLQLLRDTLTEWERHRTLILMRISHLEHQTSLETPKSA